MKNYQCSKCSAAIKNGSSPSVANCPKGGHHSWTDLGEVGTVNYQCKKCAVLIQSKSSPSVAKDTRQINMNIIQLLGQKTVVPFSMEFSLLQIQ